VIRERLREAGAARRTRWESLCRHCGLCCCEKVLRNGRWVTDRKLPCAYLDRRTNLCTVYTRRFAVYARCRPMTLLHALFTAWLPPECGYVQHYRRGRALEVDGDVGGMA
jgi:uncharacterized protein